MEWKHYWTNIVERYNIVIKGWPDRILFKNLSEVLSPLGDLEGLLQKWCSGETYWNKLTDDKLDTLRIEQNRQLEAGEIQDPAPRRCQSNCSKKCKHVQISDKNQCTS